MTSYSASLPSTIEMKENMGYNQSKIVHIKCRKLRQYLLLKLIRINSRLLADKSSWACKIITDHVRSSTCTIKITSQIRKQSTVLKETTVVVVLPLARIRIRTQTRFLVAVANTFTTKVLMGVRKEFERTIMVKETSLLKCQIWGILAQMYFAIALRDNECPQVD